MNTENINKVTRGCFITHYISGALLSEAEHINGFLDGYYKSYYEDGKINCLEEYRNGFRNGVSRSFYYARYDHDNDLEWMGYYVNGILEGETICADKN